MTASKPEVVAVAVQHKSRDMMRCTVTNIRQIEALKDGDKLIRLTDHESDRAADKARIAELEDVIGELIAGTGTSPDADRKYGRARAALSQQGKEQTP